MRRAGPHPLAPGVGFRSPGHCRGWLYARRARSRAPSRSAGSAEENVITRPGVAKPSRLACRNGSRGLAGRRARSGDPRPPGPDRGEVGADLVRAPRVEPDVHQGVRGSASTTSKQVRASRGRLPRPPSARARGDERRRHRSSGGQTALPRPAPRSDAPSPGRAPGARARGGPPRLPRPPSGRRCRGRAGAEFPVAPAPPDRAPASRSTSVSPRWPGAVSTDRGLVDDDHVRVPVDDQRALNHLRCRRGGGGSRR